MKTKSLIQALFGLTLSLSLLTAMAEAPNNLLGQPAETTAANRTITIKPDTKYVNVQTGQTVLFNTGGKAFAWNFSGPSIAFDLNRVAPPNTLDHMVKAYVADNPHDERY
jgi:hypothetical protein